jgi:hypothetical protein
MSGPATPATWRSTPPRSEQRSAAGSPSARGHEAGERDADTLYRPCEAITHPIIPTGLALYELLQPAA